MRAGTEKGNDPIRLRNGDRGMAGFLYAFFDRPITPERPSYRSVIRLTERRARVRR